MQKKKFSNHMSAANPFVTLFPYENIGVYFGPAVMLAPEASYAPFILYQRVKSSRKT